MFAYIVKELHNVLHNINYMVFKFSIKHSETCVCLKSGKSCTWEISVQSTVYLVNIFESFALIRHKFSPSLHLFQSLRAKILSIHVPIQHLLSIRYVSDTASGSGDIAVNKRVKNPCLHSGIPSKLFRLLIFNIREMNQWPADCPKPHDFPQIPYHISL